MFNRLRSRRRQPELMDQPGLDERLHKTALAGLRRINRISGSGRIVWSAISQLAAAEPGRTWSVLDIASGGGDVAMDVSDRAARAGVAIQVDGCDISPFAVRYATDQAAERKAANVRFFQRDVLNAPLPEGYDVVMCSLFLHHLEEDLAIGLLSRMAAAAKRLMLVNDLCRSTWGFAAVWLGCRVLTRSPLVRVDGPLSVQAAFSIPEVQNVARKSGLSEASVERRWPCRFLLQWRPA
jgi:SAM-dependent methyltransferase